MVLADLSEPEPKAEETVRAEWRPYGDGRPLAPVGGGEAEAEERPTAQEGGEGTLPMRWPGEPSRARRGEAKLALPGLQASESCKLGELASSRRAAEPESSCFGFCARRPVGDASRASDRTGSSSATASLGSPPAGDLVGVASCSSCASRAAGAGGAAVSASAAAVPGAAVPPPIAAHWRSRLYFLRALRAVLSAAPSTSREAPSSGVGSAERSVLAGVLVPVSAPARAAPRSLSRRGAQVTAAAVAATVRRGAFARMAALTAAARSAASSPAMAYLRSLGGLGLRYIPLEPWLVEDEHEHEHE